MQLYVTNHARNSSRIILKESIQRQGRVVFTCSSQLSLQLYFLRYSPRQDGSPVLEEMRVYPVGNGVMHYTDVSRAVAKPVVWSKLLNHTKNRTPGHMLSNNGLYLHSMHSMCYYL